jgi:hypothetical protein
MEQARVARQVWDASLLGLAVQQQDSWNLVCQTGRPISVSYAVKYCAVSASSERKWSSEGSDSGDLQWQLSCSDRQDGLNRPFTALCLRTCVQYGRSSTTYLPYGIRYGSFSTSRSAALIAELAQHTVVTELSLSERSPEFGSLPQ